MSSPRTRLKLTSSARKWRSGSSGFVPPLGSLSSTLMLKHFLIADIKLICNASLFLLGVNTVKPPLKESGFGFFPHAGFFEKDLEGTVFLPLLTFTVEGPDKKNSCPY